MKNGKSNWFRKWQRADEKSGKWKLNTETPKNMTMKMEKKYSTFTRSALYSIEFYTWIIPILPILNILYFPYSLLCMRMNKLENSEIHSTQLVHVRRPILALQQQEDEIESDQIKSTIQNWDLSSDSAPSWEFVSSSHGLFRVTEPTRIFNFIPK